MIEIVAIVSCSVLLLLAIFQILLIFGAPLGRFAWGGAHTVLPVNLRVGSFVSIILYAAFAQIILAKAGLTNRHTNTRACKGLICPLL